MTSDIVALVYTWQQHVYLVNYRSFAYLLLKYNPFDNYNVFMSDVGLCSSILSTPPGLSKHSTVFKH
jgi:hypothetical protein